MNNKYLQELEDNKDPSYEAFLYALTTSAAKDMKFYMRKFQEDLLALEILKEEEISHILESMDMLIDAMEEYKQQELL